MRVVGGLAGALVLASACSLTSDYSRLVGGDAGRGSTDSGLQDAASDPRSNFCSQPMPEGLTAQYCETFDTDSLAQSWERLPELPKTTPGTTEIVEAPTPSP